LKRRQVNAQRESFLDSLFKQPPTTTQALALMARKNRIGFKAAYKIALKQGFAFRAKRGGLATADSSKATKALMKKVAVVFTTHHHWFLRKAKPFLAKGIPLDFLYDYCLDASLRTAKNFDPKKGASFKTWITNNWRNALSAAERAWNKAKRKTINLSSLENEKSEHKISWRDKKAKTPLEQALIAESMADEAVQKQRLAVAIKTLPEMEQLVLRCRFGLDGQQPLTLEETGQRVHLTKERIRQVEKKAIERLRVILRAK